MALDGAPRIDELERVAQRAQYFAHDELVLLRLERTRRVHQPSARRQMGESVLKQTHLAIVQIAKIIRTELPTNLWVARERARAGAGNIDENAIERAFERKRLHAVQGE